MESKKKKKQTEIPVITVGKYAGTKVDALPMSYLRWMLGQDFPEEWKQIARSKLGTDVMTKTQQVEVSRHAIDRFSLRHIQHWESRTNSKTGMGTFLTEMAEKALLEGTDISKKRTKDDGQIFLYEGIKFVFTNPNEPIRTLITVMD